MYSSHPSSHSKCNIPCSFVYCMLTTEFDVNIWCESCDQCPPWVACHYSSGSQIFRQYSAMAFDQSQQFVTNHGITGRHCTCIAITAVTAHTHTECVLFIQEFRDFYEPFISFSVFGYIYLLLVHMHAFELLGLLLSPIPITDVSDYIVTVSGMDGSTEVWIWTEETGGSSFSVQAGAGDVCQQVSWSAIYPMSRVLAFML